MEMFDLGLIYFVIVVIVVVVVSMALTFNRIECTVAMVSVGQPIVKTLY